MAKLHLVEVNARRLPEIEKVAYEVQARLKKEINYWDSRAAELKEAEKAGRKTRQNWRKAEKRAEDLADRLQRRMQTIESERFISAQPPKVRGGMVVIPKGLVDGLRSGSENLPPSGFSQDPEARRRVELAAMDAVMEAEKTLGYQPTDVSAQKVGYDILSYDPNIDHYRFIEVKGRVDSADTVMLTRQEIITSLHEPDKYILAIVQIKDDFANEPMYVKGALQDHEPSFESTAIQFNLKRLLERAEGPR